MQLPINLTLSLMQTRWKSILDPFLKGPIPGVSILPNIALNSGTTVISHKLGRTQQGWFLVDIQGAATVYRSQPLNNLTLTLVSSAATTVSIGVF